MPVENKEEQERKSVIAIVVTISLIIFVFLWRFVLSSPEVDYVAPAVIKTAPKIDFDYLKSPEFEYFEEYKQIDPLEEELMGRDNPFLPY